MANLNQSLRDPLGRDEKWSIIKFFWQRNLPESKIDRYAPYFKFYSDETRRLQFSFIEKERLLPSMAAQTHADIHRIVKLLADHRDTDLPEVRTLLRAVFPSHGEKAIDNSIDLALRVWLTLKVRDQSLQLQTPHTPTIQWKADGTKLIQFVARQFPSKCPTPLDASESRLDRQFTAVYMSRACDLKVEWTSCIADHLRFDFKRNAVRIYHFKICLIDHMNASGTSLSDSLIAGPLLPKDLLEETIWSLNLLFPPDDKDTDNFLQEQGKTFHNDGPSEARPPLDLNEYSHWRERLVELRRIYMAEPENFTQFLHKRQSYDKKLNTMLTIFFGFLLATVFGVISSVTAIISTRATLKGLTVAKQALELQQQVPICPCS